MKSALAYFTRLIHAIRRQADAPQAPVQPELNRAQRRALARQKPGERRMRLERTLIAQAKRKQRNGVRGGDHGAKSRRAYLAGRKWGLTYTVQKVQQAYLLGLENGRKQRPGVLGFASRVRARARALITARPISAKAGAE